MSKTIPNPRPAAPAQSRWTALRKDGVTGLINAVMSVPYGLASAGLAGVNPIFGRYTRIAASISGSLLTSAQLMQMPRRSASALVARQGIAAYPPSDASKRFFYWHCHRIEPNATLGISSLFGLIVPSLLVAWIGRVCSVLLMSVLS